MRRRNKHNGWEFVVDKELDLMVVCHWETGPGGQFKDKFMWDKQLMLEESEEISAGEA